ncbi:glucose-methanol-choline oxidoreductase [Caballeronia glebae]|uniref:Glucose-methanol-choline oxidoreductase n=2 Tax=Caballeronia glebae TaxID=1777143 RepID=A0A158A3X4_9BURK|nr:glucose-methanol-choline oxidoreductase [Caballeronia glebae]
MSTERSDFDYIIVGAGSSGSVLADRLSRDGKSSVLLLEAGGDNESELVRMPRAFMKMWGNPAYFWQFPVKAQKGRPENETWFYGRGLGGSSSTNGTWYLRGMPADYDGWCALGMREWSWAEVERCFSEMESYRYRNAHRSRGRNGPLQVTQLPFRSRVLGAALQAGKQMGLPVLDDINTPGTQGIGYTQATVDRRGRRASAYRAFLKRAMRRSNLTVVTGALAERILFDGLRTTGVTYRENGETRIALARREVILSAGVLQSPKLLQISGVGPADVLEKAGVRVIKDVPAVGRNLADHVMFSISFRMKNDWGVNREFHGWRLMKHVLKYYLTRKGLMAYTSPEITALLSMRAQPHWPDVQFGIGPFSMRSSAQIKADPGRGALEDQPGLTLNGYYLRPKTRGSVAIQSADIADSVLVDANWWGDPDDRKALVEMLRLMRAFAAQPALATYIVKEVVPGTYYETDDEIAEALQWLVSPGVHGTGTCRMGAPGEGVVDSRLRVHGLSGLRVVDCSAMPTPPSGNTNGPAMMLGYRAAELILMDRDMATVVDERDYAAV